MKTNREEIEWLASFPKLNQNPVVELNLSEKLNYLNPAAKKLFPDLELLGIKHPYVNGLKSLLNKIKRSKDKHVGRELKIDNHWFQQTIHYIPAIKHIRIYGFNITKRKQAEEALKESETLLKKTQEIAHLGTWAYDLNKKKTYWSDETYRLYGYRPNEIIPSHKTFGPVIHPEDRKLVLDIHYNSVKSNENGYKNIFRIVKKSTGETRYLYDKCEHIRDSSGKIVRSIGMVQDITERKRAEEAMLESEKALNKSQEIAHLGSWELNLTTNKLTWSDETYRIFGLKPQEFSATYKAFLEAVHPDDRKAVDRAYSDSLREGKNSYEIEHRIIKKSTGEIRIVREKCEHTRDESGKIIFSIGMVQDITESKRAEDALKETEEKFRAVAETAKDAIISANSTGKIIYFNKGAESTFGYTAAEALNKPLTILMPQRFHQDHSNGFSRFLATHKPHVIGKTVELTGIRKNGSEFPIELSVANWTVNNDSYFTAIIRDITERKELQQRKDDFITIAGHELRTPVSAIKLMNQVLQGMLADNPEALKYLEKIERQSNIQANLVNDLLDVTKIQTGKLEIRKESFDLRDLVEEIAEVMQGTTKEHKVIVEGECVKIFTDKDRISQVLTNFCTNAIKFSPEGKKIVIELKKSKKDVVVGVTDYGIGIPKKHHHGMFKRFYRVYGSGDKTFPGLGMGLYISYHIIKLLDGKMWFESKPKKGSTFYFSIPLS